MEQNRRFRERPGTPAAPNGLKIVLVGDWASGKNAFGGGGVGAALYFTPAIALLTGPVWFNDSTLMKAAYGADFMWSFQLDVDVELLKK